MKRVLFLSLVLVFGIATAAGAGLTTITFDEPFVTGGPVGGTRQDGTQVSTQYAGVAWADIYPSLDAPPVYYTGQVVCLPGEFTGTGWTTGNTLWIYGNSLSGSGAQTATVTLSTLSNYFSMDYRRPQAAGTIEFDLYLGSNLVYNGNALSWNPGDGWKTFTAPPVMFNRIVISESDKFNVDNLSISSVPVPPSLFLLAGGLGGLGVIRKRWTKK
jgi:hypothetical protein